MLDLLGGLGDDADLLIRGQVGELVLVGDDGVVLEVSDDSFDLDMRGLADDDGVEALTNEAGNGLVDAQDQRAAGINHVVAHLAGGLVQRLRRAVGGDHDVRGGNILVELVDDIHAPGAQVFYDLRIVHQLADDGEFVTVGLIHCKIDGILYAKTGA